jgi:flagellar basal-body rod protein FlgC
MGNEGIAKGVMVESITDADNPTRIVYDPSHPDADKDGYVELPNVNVVEEMVNMVNASRAYEANITLAQTTKTMIQSAINI